MTSDQVTRPHCSSLDRPGSALASGTRPTEAKIVEIIDSQADEAIDFLERVVNINSGTLNAKGVRQVGEVYKEAFATLGFDSRLIEQPEELRRGPHLFAEIGWHPGQASPADRPSRYCLRSRQPLPDHADRGRQGLRTRYRGHEGWQQRGALRPQGPARCRCAREHPDHRGLHRRRGVSRSALGHLPSRSHRRRQEGRHRLWVSKQVCAKCGSPRSPDAARAAGYWR